MTAAIYPPAAMNTSFPPAVSAATAPALAPSSPSTLDQYPRYIPQAQYTPPQSSSGTNSNTNVSPTSPRTSINLPPHLQQSRIQQIRPPKSPMYVPAVLRPTDRPLKQSPPKLGTAVKHGSSDSVGGGNTLVQNSAGPVPGVSRAGTEEWDEEGAEKVTGRPSREHWKVCFDLFCYNIGVSA
jgi:hypothetical protein